MGGADNPIDLIRRMAGGDREAFGRFYDQYCSLVFTYALRLLRDRTSAEDLLQEVFMQIWRQAKSYDQERGSPEAWLINITRSRAIDSLRSKRRRDSSFVSTEDPGGTMANQVGSVSGPEPEVKLTVQGALARLPEAQRRVLELAYLDGLTQSEIATRLGEPLGTVKTRMRAGLQRLRETIGKSV